MRCCLCNRELVRANEVAALVHEHPACYQCMNPDEIKLCNCAGCKKLLGSIEKIAGRVKDRPYCAECLEPKPKRDFIAGQDNSEMRHRAWGQRKKISQARKIRGGD